MWLRDADGDGRADLFVAATSGDRDAGRVWNLRAGAPGNITSGA